jgi:hypothetical protein
MKPTAPNYVATAFLLCIAVFGLVWGKGFDWLIRNEVDKMVHEIKKLEASTVVLVLELPRQPELRTKDGTPLDLGQIQGGVDGGKYVGYVNSSANYIELSPKRLDELARAGGYANIKELDKKRRQDAAEKRRAEWAERAAIPGTSEANHEAAVKRGNERRRQEFLERRQQQEDWPPLSPASIVWLVIGLIALGMKIFSAMRPTPAMADIALKAAVPVVALRAAGPTRARPRMDFGKR